MEYGDHLYGDAFAVMTNASDVKEMLRAEQLIILHVFRMFSLFWVHDKETLTKT